MTRKRDKQKAKEDEKLEKRRLKEEKLKKNAEKEKEREKEREKKKLEKQSIKQTKGPTAPTMPAPTALSMIEDFAQSETNRIPLFLEKCVQFIEDEGLDSEGIYRVPGNRAHVELLFSKFEEGESLFFLGNTLPCIMYYAQEFHFASFFFFYL